MTIGTLKTLALPYTLYDAPKQGKSDEYIWVEKAGESTQDDGTISTEFTLHEISAGDGSAANLVFEQIDRSCADLSCIGKPAKMRFKNPKNTPGRVSEKTLTFSLTGTE